MSGESFFGWVKGIGALLVLAVVALVAWKVYEWVKGKGGVAGAVIDAANTIKESTPLGAPSRAIDSTISAATGRTETLGGFLADLFNPAARKVNEIYGPSQDRIKPTGSDIYSMDNP